PMPAGSEQGRRAAEVGTGVAHLGHCELHASPSRDRRERVAVQAVVRSFLAWIAKFIGNNRGNDRRQLYPQLWDCWPKWTGRKNPRIFAARTLICGWLTGHEISRTEWGYGGGKYADMNCRWCDKTIRVPVADTFKPEGLPDLGDTDAI
ncbi:MAG TPA: hypothetical protein PK556_12595, partial [Smithellaceae bacterium]|nr:hypothetical protein [Smithellaceae bacterium]